MFPALMPWPMTLAPRMKLSDVKIMQKKPLIRKKITDMIWEVMKDVRTVLPSNKRKIFLRVGERLIELMAVPYIFA
jgi:hypothetical protein